MPKKPKQSTPSLFGDDGATKPEKKPRKPHPLGPWWEAIAKLIGLENAKAAGGRVWGVAAKIKDAGIEPEQLAKLPEVIKRYAGWRKVLDIAAITQTWVWLIEPPREIGRTSPIRDATESINSNGGDSPF